MSAHFIRSWVNNKYFDNLFKLIYSAPASLKGVTALLKNKYFDVFSKMCSTRSLAGCICALILSISVQAETLQPNGSEESSITGTFKQLTSQASEIMMNSMGMLGIRYQRGGNSPESGLDCSGLVRYVFKGVLGLDLPRTAKEISQIGQKIDPRDIQPGDLVFFNTLKHHFSHVGIYLGDNKFIHSPSQGGQVRIESMDLDYWKKRFNGIRRINEKEPSS